MTINEQLKALRIEAGLTQEQLAKMISPGYTRQKMNDFESGRKPVGLKIIESWATACGKEVEIVFRDRETYNPD